ncbi:unnamed protein product, partial [Effrenium voratum]
MALAGPCGARPWCPPMRQERRPGIRVGHFARLQRFCQGEAGALPSLPPLNQAEEDAVKKTIWRRQAKAPSAARSDARKWRFAARGGRWQEAVDLLGKAQVPLQEQDFSFVIDSCSKAGAWEAVLGLFFDMEPLQLQPDTPCFSLAVTAAERVERKEELSRVLCSVPDLDAQAYTGVLRASTRSGAAEGLGFLEQALGSCTLPEAGYVHGINLCAQTGAWELSLQVLREVVEQGVVRKVDVKMLGAARAACLQSGQWRRVLELSERMALGQQPDAYGYAVQMTALEKLGEVAAAYELFREMVERQVPINQHVYTALMGDGDGSDTGWERAVLLLEDAQRRQVDVSQVMVGKAIKCCAAAAAWPASLQLLSDMGPDASVAAVSSALCACGTGMQWERALGLLAWAPKMSVQPDAELWNSAIYACGLAGQGRKAKQMLTNMKKRKLMPTVACYNSALVAIGQDAPVNLKQAERLLSLMRKDQLEPTTVTLNAALGLHVKSGQWEEALALGARLQRQQVAVSEVTYGALIGTCRESRQWPVALALLEASLAQPQSTSVLAFNVAASVCETCGEWQQAVALLRRMPELQLTPDLISYNTALAACAGAGAWQLALQLFEEMKRLGLAPDVYTYSSVIAACNMALQWEWAVNLWNEMEKQGIVATEIVFNSVVNVCSRCGQQAWVDYLLAEMEHRGLVRDIVTYRSAIAPISRKEEVSNEAEVAEVTAEPQASEQVAEPEEEESVLNGDSVKTFMNKLEGASNLFAQALSEGAFAPWVRDGRLLDLHGMSTEVAKVAVYAALRGVTDLPEDDLAFCWGLKIIVGRGLHSRDGQVVLEPAIRELLEEVFQLRVSSTVDGTFRVVPE